MRFRYRITTGGLLWCCDLNSAFATLPKRAIIGSSPGTCRNCYSLPCGWGVSYVAPLWSTHQSDFTVLKWVNLANRHMATGLAR